MSQETENDFLSLGGEEYDEIPSGDFSVLTNIGKAKTSQGWKVFVDGDTATEGEYPTLPNPLTRGFYFLPGERDEAQAFAKKYLGREFVSRHLLTAMPVASITNMSDETRAKFTSPVVQADCRVIGLPKEYADPNKKNGQGLNLVTMPSFLDAYARRKGWYTDPLFDISIIAGLGTDADVSPSLWEKLVQQRQNIWVAYGEKAENWRESKTDKLASPRLREGIATTINRTWEGWVRMATVPDPSPSAFYVAPDKDTGENKAHRNRVAVVLEFFANERVAIEIGTVELAKFSTATATSNGSTTPSKFSQLSAKAQKDYGNQATWDSVVPSVVEDLKTMAVPAVAARYGLTVEDVQLVK